MSNNDGLSCSGMTESAWGSIASGFNSWDLCPECTKRAFAVFGLTMPPRESIPRGGMRGVAPHPLLRPIDDDDGPKSA